MTSSAPVAQGSRVTLAPRSRNWRTIESLMPVSSATTCGPSPSISTGASGRDLGGEVGAGHRGLCRDQLACVVLRCLGAEDAAPHRARVTDVADERASVYPGDGGNAAVAQPVEPAALGGGGVLGVAGVAHDRRAGVDAVRFHRLLGNAVVADHRIGEGDELARVRGVGHGLLVAGHRGVEDDLADGASRPRRRSISPSKSVPSSSRT